MKLPSLVNAATYTCGLTRPLFGPRKITWEITSLCNSRCKICSRWKNKKEEGLPLERGLELLEELKTVGAEKLILSGGEPLLRKDFFELVARAKQLGLNVSMNSNGILTSNKELAQKIINSKIDAISFSLDGSSAEVHDSIRGVEGNFKMVEKAIKNIINLRTNKCPKVNINFTITAQNQDELIPTLKLAKQWGVDGATVQPVQHSAEMNFIVQDMFALTPETLGKVKSQLKQAVKEHKDILVHDVMFYEEIPTLFESPKSLYTYGCAAGYFSGIIHPNGDVYACPMYARKMGNVANKSFKEVWFSKEANTLRKDIRDGKHPICWLSCTSPTALSLDYLKHPLRAARKVKADLFEKFV